MRPLHLGIALSLGSAFLGAVSLIAYKAAGVLPEPALLVLAVLGTAAVLNTVAFGRQALVMERARRVELVVSAVLAFLTVVANLAVLASLATLNPALVSVLTSTQVLIVGFLGWPVLGERLTARFALGAIIALIGFAIIRAPAAPSEVAAVLDPGSLWALLAALAWALMQIVARRSIKLIRPSLVNLIRLWMAALGLAAVLWVRAGAAPDLASVTPTLWLLVGIGAVSGPFLARLSLLHAVRYMPAAHSTLLTLAGPIFAAILALLVFGSLPTLRELLGAGVLMVGIALPARELARRSS